MKIVRFLEENSKTPQLGFLLKEKIFPFSIVRKKSEKNKPSADFFNDISAYLQNLPKSENRAKVLFDYASNHFSEFNDSEIYRVGKIGQTPNYNGKIKLLPPVIPPALFDFGLSPRHLKNSAMTLLRHEYSPFVEKIAGPFLKRKLDRNSKSEILLYYKGNRCEIIGSDDFVTWPKYSSYLDIEPELGIVVGTEAQPLAGYLIFNDTSARDIQFPEMIGTGPARSKDFSKSNGIGPYLVTPDEVPDPLNLKVEVVIKKNHSAETRFHWEGSTSEYIRDPYSVINYLKGIFTPPPGTLIGMGTIPDCTGLDNDRWLCPGDVVEITFEKLGTLCQRIPETIEITGSRWKKRKELEGFYL